MHLFIHNNKKLIVNSVQNRFWKNDQSNGIDINK
jgi:hypothetical protein